MALSGTIPYGAAAERYSRRLAGRITDGYGAKFERLAAWSAWSPAAGSSRPA